MGTNKDWKFETKQLHVGQETPDPATDACAVPIYQTTSYIFKDTAQAIARFNLSESGNVYSRITNPTQDVFERRIAALENGVGALALATGAAAVTYSILNLAVKGDHIISATDLYGGTYNLMAHTLPDYGIETTFVDQNDPANFEKAIRPNTKAIYGETIGNPNATIIDVEAVAKIAHKHKIPFIVDNTFATPYLIRPIEYGADVVVHSATKFIGGHGTSMGGVIVDGGNFDWSASDKFPGISEPIESYHGKSFVDVGGNAAYIKRARSVLLRDMGASIAPLNSFLFLQGLETLSLRVERHVENALKVVNYLAAHPKVERVKHPALKDHPHHALYQKNYPNGGASIFSFNIKGDEARTLKFIDNLKVFSMLANVADVKSLVIHPATTTHSQLNEAEMAEQDIQPNSVRLSIGIEHIDDIIADLEQALASI
ncbi:MAG: O-acetylhomoserine aminocarboxypropyltransferase/cysteine synthase [Chloroflexi bacterium]|nr:O-acetylhomoserine aminocarboxypropyltransferase/cysteine synthase [Chloroflexota bacterium]